MWLEEVSAAATAQPAHTLDGTPLNRERARPVYNSATPRGFENPSEMLEHILRDRYGLAHPYRRPAVLDGVQELSHGPKDVRSVLEETPTTIDLGVPAGASFEQLNGARLDEVTTEPVRFRPTRD